MIYAHINVDDIIQIWMILQVIRKWYNPCLDGFECVSMSSKSGYFVQSIFGWLCILQNRIFCIILIWMILNILVTDEHLSVPKYENVVKKVCMLLHDCGCSYGSSFTTLKDINNYSPNIYVHFRGYCSAFSNIWGRFWTNISGQCGLHRRRI